MKAKRILTASCILLTLSLLVAIVFALISTDRKVMAYSVRETGSVLGTTQFVVTAGTASTVYVNLSASGSNVTGFAGSAGTATVTGGTGSTPCNSMQLALALSGTGNTTADILVGTSSSTCNFPVYATCTTSGGTSTQSILLPQVNNTNQLWMSLTNSSSILTTAGTISAIYQK